MRALRGRLIAETSSALLAAVLCLGARADASEAKASDPKAPSTQSSGAGTSASTAADTDEELEQRLQLARERLENEAREVAELSARLGAEATREVWVSTGFSRVGLGVQLDPHSGPEGARVVEVSPGGPASEAGVRRGDVITALDSQPTTGSGSARTLTRLMRTVPADRPVKLHILREGAQRVIDVTPRRIGAPWPLSAVAPALAAPPAPPAPGSGPVVIARQPGMPALPDLMWTRMLGNELSGMELVTLTPALGQYFGTDKGVLVIRAPREQFLQLHDGDVILAIDGREPRSGMHATSILRSYQPGEHVTLKIMRHDKPVTLTAVMPGTAPRDATAYEER